MILDFGGMAWTWSRSGVHKQKNTSFDAPTGGSSVKRESRARNGSPYNVLRVRPLSIVDFVPRSKLRESNNGGQ